MTNNHNFPTRLQIAVSNVLVAEVILPQYMADKTWASWAMLRYKRNEPMGSASICHVDTPRLWDVAVGSIIYEYGVN
jgi:hypothetical protein